MESIRNNWDKSNLKSYYHGLWIGLCEKMNEEREIIKQSTNNVSNALIVIDKEIEVAMNEHYNNLRTSKPKMISLKNNSMNHEIVAGKNININQGISSNVNLVGALQ